jgi:TonB family protein
VLKTTMASANTGGKPVYMAPECFEGKRSERSDLWSVGVILYQLATGRLPFPQADAISLMNAILTREPEIDANALPPGLAAFVRRALEKDPARRFQSAAEMSAALRSVDLSATVPWTEARTEVCPAQSGAVRMEPTQAAVGPGATFAEIPAKTKTSVPGGTLFGAPTPPPPAPPDRRWLLGLGGAALLLLIFSVMGIWYFTRSPSTTVVGGKTGSSSPLAPLVPDGVTITPPANLAAADIDPGLMSGSAIVVTVPYDSGIYVNRVPVTFDQLAREVARLLARPSSSYFQSAAPAKPIYVLADVAVTYSRFVEICNELRKPGVNLLGLVGLRKADRGSAGILPFNLASPVNGFQTSAPLGPGPLRLVVKIGADGRLTLNTEDEGTVADSSLLSAQLAEILAERPRIHSYQSAAPVSEKTVYVDAESSVKYGDLVKIVDVIKGAGSDRIVSGAGLLVVPATTRTSGDPNGIDLGPPITEISPGSNTNTGGVGTGSESPASSAEKVYRANEVTQKARIISKPTPEYTEQARLNNTVGTVRLSAVFTATGQVTNIRPLNQLPDGLTEKAIAAARRIQFTPAQKDGQAVSSYITLEYNFNVY